jgi:hypothetical protein
MIALPLLLALAAGASHQAPRPAARPPLTITPERILAEPGPVLRAHSLIGAPAMPAGVSVTFACKLGLSGVLQDCAPTGGARDWAAFAARRLPGYRIAVVDLRLNPLETVPTQITIALAPADRRETALTGPIAPDSSQLTFVARANNRVAQAFYPSRALRGEIELNVIVACPEAAVAGELPKQAKALEGLADQFGFAAQQLTGMMRVAPTLKDGRASEGHQFRMVVAFRMQAI